MRGHCTELDFREDSRPVFGCDIARYGDDYTVIYEYRDGRVRLLDRWNKTNSMTTAEKIVTLAHERGAKEVRIDAVGMGGPVYDRVAQLSDARFETVGMIGIAQSPDLDLWLNARAYWYDNVRERMYAGEIDISIEDRELEDELGNLEYKFTNRGAIQIESKDDIKARVGKSPDYADAMIYACAFTGVNPEDPQSKFKVGEEYSLGLEDFLDEEEMWISPL
jgi:hypothetical protein